MEFEDDEENLNPGPDQVKVVWTRSRIRMGRRTKITTRARPIHRMGGLEAAGDAEEPVVVRQNDEKIT